MIFDSAEHALNGTWYAIGLAVLNTLQTIALAFIAAKWHLRDRNGSAS